MSSRRKDERNEKIIRGLMKLPPNRRCINCNSVGPQYVCTNFWTFVCIACSGIHREFTHRVKSVSMAKFSSEEVDALQKGGNQRARELYLKAWPEKIRLPDNSNTDKVRDFIKKVYVDKKFSGEELSDTASRESESFTSHENETRRASSYHSYSQSPPYDFQYEERRYGKHAITLTRKGSDRGLYEGKLASFLSPTRSSHHANEDSVESERSYPRHSDYSVSPSSQRGNGSPLSETSGDISSKVPKPHKAVHNLGANSRSNGGGASHPQRTASFGSFVISKPDKSSEKSLDKSPSLSSLPQSSGPTTFGGLDLFDIPCAPQNVTSATFTCTNTEATPSPLAQSANLNHQSPLSSVPTFTDQQPSQTPQPSQLDLLTAQSQRHSAASANGKAFDVVMPNTGAWTTFDTPQNMVHMGTGNFTPSPVQFSDGKTFEKFNPFLMDQSASYRNSHACGHESRSLNVVASIHNPHAFNDGNVKILDRSEPPSSSLSSNFSMVPNGFPMVSAVAGMHTFSTNHEPTNPFDQPCHSEMESSTMSQFWDMSSLQAALPNAQAPATNVGGTNQSWFPPNSVPSYDPTIGSLGYGAGQAATTQIPNIHAQGPVASVGGNPFA